MQIAFMLHVDEVATSVFDTLDAAKAAATPHIANRTAVRVVTFAGTAPSEAWYYDYDINAWVHQPNAAVGA